MTKKNCKRCRALEEIVNDEFLEVRCTLGYIILIHEDQTVIPLNDCPKPKTWLQYAGLLKEKKK